MNAFFLFQRLTAAGVVLTPDPDGALRYKAPTGVLTPGLLDALRQHKDELVTVVEAFEERAAMAEYCGGLTRAEAEQLALRCLGDDGACVGHMATAA